VQDDGEIRPDGFGARLRALELRIHRPLLGALGLEIYDLEGIVTRPVRRASEECGQLLAALALLRDLAPSRRNTETVTYGSRSGQVTAWGWSHSNS
jgi:hypothetical protein